MTAKRTPGGSAGEAEQPPDDVVFEAKVRIDTPNEVAYFQNGGILHRVLRTLRERG